jgi:hypothetical protein
MVFNKTNYDIGVEHLLHKKLKTRPPWVHDSIDQVSQDEIAEAFEDPRVPTFELDSFNKKLLVYFIGRAKWQVVDLSTLQDEEI